MKPFYFVLMVFWGALAFYTGFVVMESGLNLLPAFFGDLADWSWAGQFNFDFMLMLFLSASWTAWRNSFSPAGIVLALIAFFGGAGFMLPYLTYLAWKHEGDTSRILLGSNFQETAA